MIGKFFVFQMMILAAFLAGSAIRRKFRDPLALSKRMINLNLIFIEPLIVFWSVWALDLTTNLFILPLSGLLIALFGMLAGVIFNILLNLRDKKKTTFLISAGLSNQGFTMGGFLCYLLFGEKGLALSVIFISYFMPFVFLFIFPYAKRAGLQRQTARATFLKRAKPFFLNLQNMPLYAIVMAVFFQVSGLKRPAVHFPLEPLLLASVGLYYLSLGIHFKSVHIRGGLKENLALAAVKFLIIPAAAISVLGGLPFDPAFKQVIMLESLMPAAIYSVVSSILFDLDSGLASGMFVLNTLFFLVLVLPFIMLGGGVIFAF